jgi:hypothetical protein
MLSSNLANRLKRNVTIQHHTESGTADVYGTDIPGVVDVKVLGELQQHSRDEAEGTLSQTNWILFLPPNTPIDTNDVVLVDNDAYEVIGDPWQAFNPRTGEFEHVEVSLRRTSGEEQAA